MPEIDIFEQENEVQARTFIPQDVEVQQYIGSVEVGNVTTLPAGSQATVTNVGDNTHAVLDFGLPKGDAGSMWGELAGDLEDQTDLYTVLTGLQTAIDGKAALASPAFTGTPTAPTAVDGTNTAQIATTAFVKNAITNLQNSLQTYINTQVNKMLGRIDYSNGVSLSLSTNGASYSVPSDGYVFLLKTGNTQYTASGSLLINGKGVASWTGGGTIFHFGTSYPVSQGDVVSLATGSGSQASPATITFAPQKS